MKIRTIALVAHDNCKKDLIEWVHFNRGTLERYRLVCTGTTGRLVQEALEEDGQKDLNITRLKSGPLGGDQQLGALIAEEVIDMIVFFWDPMQPQPHDVDVKALLRISNLYNIPTAYNRSTADFLISSPLFKEDYDRKVRDYSGYLNRELKEATSGQ
jgi:methylglyoxal synthase